MIRISADSTGLTENTVYISIRKAERNIINAPFYLYLYLPARTALVFKREPIRKQPIFSQSTATGRNPVYEEDLHVSDRSGFHKRKNLLFQEPDWPCKDISRSYSLSA